VPQLAHQHNSEKILCDELRTDPDLVTVICLGPLTNIARAFQRDSTLANSVGRLIILGGAVNGIGNVTPAAEFNMYYDPESAREIFRSGTTKTLVPLDITRQVTFGFDLMNELPPESTRPGAFLRRLMSHSFRAHRQVFALESIYLHAAVGVMAAIHPELFEMKDMAGDVETHGDLAAGATIFDRRPEYRPRANMEVATEVDAAGVRDAVVRGLAGIGK
jgi:inosine-uridine nucleoside N-ribohydrolase